MELRLDSLRLITDTYATIAGKMSLSLKEKQNVVYLVKIVRYPSTCYGFKRVEKSGDVSPGTPFSSHRRSSTSSENCFTALREKYIRLSMYIACRHDVVYDRNCCVFSVGVALVRMSESLSNFPH